jgi:hypothetical protein
MAELPESERVSARVHATIAVEARLARNKTASRMSNVTALQAMYGESFSIDTSSRVPLPFSGAFSCFRFRAFLLLLILPCTSVVLKAVVVISWASGWLDMAVVVDEHSDNEAMAVLDIPSSFAIQILLSLLVWRRPS